MVPGVAEGMYSRVLIIIKISSQYIDVTKQLDALTEAPTFVEGPSSKPVFALAGLVSAASVQSSGSPFEWSSVQHAVSGVIEQTTIAAAATTVTTGLRYDMLLLGSGMICYYWAQV